MTRLIFSLDENDGHYYIPVSYWLQESEPSLWTRGYVDTGATKCMMPRISNESELKLPISGQNHVSVANGYQDMDYVIIPKVSIYKNLIRRDDGSLVPKTTDLEVVNVETWLGDTFLIGMNFLSRFDLFFKKKGQVIIGHRLVTLPF